HADVWVDDGRITTGRPELLGQNGLGRAAGLAGDPPALAGGVPVIDHPPSPALANAGHRHRLCRCLGLAAVSARSRTSRATALEIPRSPRSPRATLVEVTPRRSASWRCVRPRRLRSARSSCPVMPGIVPMVHTAVKPPILLARDPASKRARRYA